MLWNSKLVILDEPTAALGVAQTEQVLKLVRRLADRGLGVLLISHNMNDVFEVADNIAVLYLGQMAAQVHANDVTNNQVVELITTGRRGGGLARSVASRRSCPRRPGSRTATTGREGPAMSASRPPGVFHSRWRITGVGGASATTSQGARWATSGRCPPCWADRAGHRLHRLRPELHQRRSTSPT